MHQYGRITGSQDLVGDVRVPPVPGLVGEGVLPAALEPPDPVQILRDRTGRVVWSDDLSVSSGILN